MSVEDAVKAWDQHRGSMGKTGDDKLGMKSENAHLALYREQADLRGPGYMRLKAKYRG